MPSSSKNQDTYFESNRRKIRPEIIEKGKRLAQDPGYPDKKVIRKIAEKLAAEALEN